MGIKVRRPTNVGKIGNRPSTPRPTREEVLRKKFAFISIINELDLVGLEELNEWYEDLRYKEGMSYA